MTTEPANPFDEVLEVLRHPVRREVLRLYLASKDAISPVEIAQLLPGRPVNDLAYHIRVLYDRRVLRLSKTEPVRGATKHYYRATGKLYTENRSLIESLLRANYSE